MTEFAAATTRLRPIAGGADLARDYPKGIVVAGIWLFFLPGLFGNLSVLIAALSGGLGGLIGVVLALFSLGCSALCAYVLYRAVKNYKIHLARRLQERAAEVDALAFPAAN